MASDVRNCRGLSVLLLAGLGAASACSGDDEVVPSAPDAAIDADVSDANHCVEVDCLPQASCPSPTSSSVANVCGTVRRIETSSQLECTTTPSLEAAVFDALAFAASTPEQRPAPLAVVDVDLCAHFWVIGLVPPATGMVVVAIDDKGTFRPGGPAQDLYALTAVTVPVAANTSVKPDVYVTTRELDAHWTSTAGDPGGMGQSFAEQGVYVPIFFDTTKPATMKGLPGAPVPGVGVTATDGDVFYFVDTHELTRTSVAPDATATGVNGSALVIGPSSMVTSADGPAGCTWAAGTGAPLPGAIVVQERLGTCN